MSHGHPIRVAAKKAGLSPHLIRMWERRYAAVKPLRSETGRRLYTDDDIERLSLLRRATLAGESIGQIADLSTEELRGLVVEEVSSLIEEAADRTTVERYLDLCVQAMQNLDASEFEVRLLRASVTLGQRVFLEQLLHPLLERTGEMWADGRLRVAHEHLASAVIRSLLGSIRPAVSSNGSSPLLVTATPAGQQHEFGALMAAVTAASSGWRSLYLGANIPAEDIVDAARSRNADAIALSLVYPFDDPRAAAELRKISDLTAGGIRLLVGGRAAESYAAVLEEIGARRITTLDDLRNALAGLSGTLHTGRATHGG